MKTVHVDITPNGSQLVLKLLKLTKAQTEHSRVDHVLYGMERGKVDPNKRISIFQNLVLPPRNGQVCTPSTRERKCKRRI